ncbi:tetratricopeptide repeat protein [Leptolinea tardivitalis]|nr:tetratricopeptide repeat protein [Leptolinea tardivitalis]GAP20029.1 protein containing TPR repeat [Leptolinea tardivitalis]
MTAGQGEAAESILLHIQKAEPWRKLNWSRLAGLYLQQGKWDKAERVLEPLEKRQMLDSNGWLTLASVYLHEGKEDEAEKGLIRAVSKSQTVDESQSSAGALVRFYRSKFRFAEALTALRGLSKNYPETEKSRAEEIFLQTVLQPETGLAEWVAWSDKPEWMQVWGQAMNDGIRTGDETMRWMAFGRAYGAAGQWDLAEYCLAKTVEITPDYAEAYGLLAEARQQQGKDGRPDIEKALQISPKSTVVRLLSAIFYRRQHAYTTAVGLLQENIDNEPDNPIWFQEMGQTLAEAGRLEEAEMYYQKAIDLTPTEVSRYLSAIKFHLQYEYRIDEAALPLALQAAALEPDRADTQDALGQVYFALGDLTKADAAFSTACQKDGRYVPVWLHIGQSAIARNNFAQAKDALLKVISMDKESTEGRVAARLLKQYFAIGDGGSESPD